MNDHYEMRIADLEDQIKALEIENKNLTKQLEKASDTCEVCGCNEFLCGHNKRD